MALTGGCAFYTRSKCLLQDGSTIVASSGTASADRCLDRNPVSYWRSVGSTDATTEELEITFASTQTFNRLFVMDHNWKGFNAKYWNGSAYVDFTSVIGLAGSQASVTETTFSSDTAYYEFAQVTATKIRIQVTTTQVANAQKYAAQVIVCSELGTLVGYPDIKDTEVSRNLRTEKMLSGRYLTFKSDDFYKVTLEFKDYPASLSADIDLIFSLQDMEETFLIWLCGGRSGSTYFRKQMRGYRLRDVIPVQLIDTLKPIYSKNVYTNSVNFSAKFQESVD